MNNNYFGIYVQALLNKNSAKSLQKELNAIKDLQVKVTPTFGKINKSALSQATKDIQNQLNEVNKKSSKLDITPKIDEQKVIKQSTSITKVSDALKAQQAIMNSSSKEYTGFDNTLHQLLQTSDGLLGTMSKVAIWGIATNAVYGTKRAIEELAQDYVELESKLISIERVSNNFNMGKVFDLAYQSSQRYGAGLMDMLDSMEEITRSYSDLNEQQVASAATAGILASTIAEMDGEEAVGAIIAVSNAYGLAIEDGEKLIDMANEVDNNFSVTATNIARAWEKTAATAKTFGVDIETVTGYIAAISTVTQESGDVIGNGLKTIFSRITTMDAARSAIEGVGVAIEDTAGDVRDTQDIISDLAGVWNTLSAAQQQNIGVQVAGRYQLTRFLALMNNWEIASDATATAMNSQGSAARENEKYLDSYEAKLKQLENAQLALAENMGNSSISFAGKEFIDLKIAITDAAAAYFKFVDAGAVSVGVLTSLVGLVAKTSSGFNLLYSALKFIVPEQQALNILEKVNAEQAEKIRLQKAIEAAELQEKAAKYGLLVQAETAETAATTANTAATSLNTIAENVNNQSSSISVKNSNAEAAAEAKDTAATTANTAAKVANATAGKVSSTVMGSLSTMMGGASVAAGLLSVAMKAIPWMVAISAIGAIVKVGASWIKNIIEQNKLAKEQNENLQNNKVQVEASAQAYRDASAAKNEYLSSGKSTNTQEYAQLLQNEKDAWEKYAEEYPAIKKKLLSDEYSANEKLNMIKDAENKALEDSRKKFNQYIENYNKATENYNKAVERRKEVEDAGYDTSKPTGIQLAQDGNRYQNFDLKQNQYNQPLYASEDNNVKDTFRSVKDSVTELIEEEYKLAQANGTLTIEEQKMIETLEKEGQARIKTKDDANAYRELMEQLIYLAHEGELTTDDFSGALDAMGLTFTEKDSILKDFVYIQEKTVNGFEDMSEGIKDFDDTTANAIDAFYGLSDGTEDALDKMYNLTQIQGFISDSDWATAVDGFSSSVQFLGQSVWDTNASLETNISTLNAVRETLAIARSNEEAYNEAIANGTLYVAKGHKQAMQDMINQRIAKLEADKISAQAEIKTLETQLSGKKAEAQGEISTNNAASKSFAARVRDYIFNSNNMVAACKNMFDALSGKSFKKTADNTKSTTTTMSDAASRIKQLKSDIASYDKQIANLKGLKLVETTVDSFKKSTGGATSATKAATEAYKKAEEALTPYSDAVEAIDNELKILQEQQERNIEGSNAWFNNYAAQEKVVRKYQSAINTYISQIQAQLRNQALDSSSKTKLKNKIQDLRLEYEKLNTVVHDNIEEQKDYYKDEIKNRLEQIKDLEDKRHKEALNRIKKEREAFKKQIEEQINLLKKAKDARSYEQDLKDLQEQRLDILGQISRLEGDDSRLAKSKLKDLYDELDDVNEQLSDLNFDRDVELREGALDDLEEKMEGYYDRLEEIEDNKNELITDTIDKAKDSLDDLTWSLGGLKEELRKWTNNLSSFSHWADGFDALVSTMPQQNIVSATMPITTYDENGNPVTTNITFQISGNAKDATDIATEVVDKLKQAGVITNKN